MIKISDNLGTDVYISENLSYLAQDRAMMDSGLENSLFFFGEPEQLEINDIRFL